MVAETEFSDGIGYHVITVGDPQVSSERTAGLAAVSPKQQQPGGLLPLQSPEMMSSLNLEIPTGL